MEKKYEDALAKFQESRKELEEVCSSLSFFSHFVRCCTHVVFGCYSSLNRWILFKSPAVSDPSIILFLLLLFR